MTALIMIIEYVMNFTENAIGLLFIEGILNIKRSKTRKRYLAAALTALGLQLLNYNKLLSVSASMYGIIVLSISIYLLYKENILDIIVVSTAYLLFLHLYNMLLITAMSLLSRNATFGAELISGYSLQRSIIQIMTIAGLVFLYWIFRNYILEKLTTIWRKLAIGFGLCTGLIFYLEYLLLSQSADGNSLRVGTLIGIEIVMLIYISYQYLMIREQRGLMTLLQERNNVALKGYEALRKNYEENAVFYHDIKTRFLILNLFFQKEDYAGAKVYIEKMIEKVENTVLYTWTGNERLDFLLNYKKQLAEQKNIQFNVQTDQICLTDQQEEDIISLLGNLLDNAMEACEKISKKNKSVRVALKSVNQMLFIKVDNTCLEKPKEEKQVLQTSKANKKQHGWGLCSVQMIVEKYQGTLKRNYHNEVFSIMIGLYDLDTTS